MLNKFTGVTMKNSIFALISAFFLLMVSCGEHSSPVATSTPEFTGSVLLSGKAYKGPYFPGSDATITEYILSASLQRTQLSQTANVVSQKQNLTINDSSGFSTYISENTNVVKVEVFGETLNEFYSTDSTLSAVPGAGAGDPELTLRLQATSILDGTDSSNVNINVLSHLTSLKLNDLVSGDMSLVTQSMIDSASKIVLSDLKLDTTIDVYSISYASEPELSGKLLGVANVYLYVLTRAPADNYDILMEKMHEVFIDTIDANSLFDWFAYISNEHYWLSYSNLYQNDFNYSDYTGTNKHNPFKSSEELLKRCDIAVDSLNNYSEIDYLIGNDPISDEAKISCKNYIKTIVNIDSSVYETFDFYTTGDYEHSHFLHKLLMMKNALPSFKEHFCVTESITDDLECFKIDRFVNKYEELGEQEFWSYKGW